MRDVISMAHTWKQMHQLAGNYFFKDMAQQIVCDLQENDIDIWDRYNYYYVKSISDWTLW